MRLPRIPTVFKLTEHNRIKRFDYKPRTFDEQKERLEKRRGQIEKELAFEKKVGTNYEEHLRERISDSWGRRETRRQKRNSSVRLLVILGALILIMYFIYAKYVFS